MVKCNQCNSNNLSTQPVWDKAKRESCSYSIIGYVRRPNIDNCSGANKCYKAAYNKATPNGQILPNISKDGHLHILALINPCAIFSDFNENYLCTNDWLKPMN